MTTKGKQKGKKVGKYIIQADLKFWLKTLPKGTEVDLHISQGAFVISRRYKRI